MPGQLRFLRREAHAARNGHVVEVREIHLAPQLVIEVSGIPQSNPVARSWEKAAQRSLLKLLEVRRDRVELQVKLEGREAEDLIKPNLIKGSEPM